MAQSISVRRDPNFQKLWFGQSVSVFGSLISRIAIPFLAVIELDATPFDMAALGIAALLPGFLVGLLAGAWIDRRKRRPVMIGADLGRAAVLVLVPILALADQLHIWHLLVVSGLLSMLSMLFDIAYQSYLPGLVGRERLIEGNSTLTATESVAEFGSFSIGGWLVQIFTAPFALLVDAVTFLLSAFAIKKIALPEEIERDAAVETSLLDEAVAGFSYVRQQGTLRVLAVAQALLSLSHGMTSTVFFLFVVDTLGFETGPLGIIFAFGGIASLGAALISSRLYGAGHHLVRMAFLLFFVAAANSVLPFARAADWIAVALLLVPQLLSDPAETIFNIHSTTLRQVLAPDAWLGRINGSFRVLEVGAIIAGSLVAAWTGEHLGLRVTMWMAAGFVALGGFACLLGSRAEPTTTSVVMEESA
ncbi:MAG: MFS transporter [Thermomicrobiales bacterium]|nr:MAG: MFS transporter [Thermomicrobiales bacterium]